MRVQLPLYLKLVVILLGLILFVFALDKAATVLIPLAFAILFSFLLYPICRRLEKGKVPRWLAIILSLLFVLLVIGGVVFVIYDQLVSLVGELPVISARMEMQLNYFQYYIEDRFGVTSESQLIYLNQSLDRILENSGQLFSNILLITSGVLAKVLLVPIYIFFILYYRGLIKEFIFRATPQDRHEQAAEIIKKVQMVIQNYIVGLFTVICIVAILNVLGLFILGVNHAVFFGVFAALLTIIPYIGVFIGSALPVVYAFAMSDTLLTPFLVLAIFLGIQTLEGNIITPNITGSKVSINPLAAILALFIGAEIWGIAGMIMFVPFVAILKVILDHVESLKPYGLILGTVDKSKMRFGNILNTIALKGFTKNKKSE